MTLRRKSINGEYTWKWHLPAICLLQQPLLRISSWWFRRYISINESTVFRSHYKLLCPCQPKRKCVTYTAIILREDSSEFYECPSDFSMQIGTAFLQEILTVSMWNFQLPTFIIIELIQRLMIRKLPCWPTHRLMIASISTPEYKTVA